MIGNIPLSDGDCPAQDQCAHLVAYRQFLENSGDILYTHDLSGRMLSVFGAMGNLGYTRAELCRMSLAELAQPASYRAFQAQLQEQVAKGSRSPKLYLLILRSKSGDEVALECNCQIIWDEDRAVSVHGIARDKTREWMAEQQLSEREEHFRMLAELAPAAAFIVVDQQIAWANHAAELVSGYSAEELHGLALARLVHCDDVPFVTSNASARPGNEDVQARYEFRMQRKDGEVRWVDFSAGVVTYRGQRAIFGTALDITAQKHAQVALLRSEELFRSVIESSADIITIISDEGTVRYGSPAISRHLGWTPEELIGTNAFALVHPEDLPAALQGVKQGIEDYRKYPPVEVRVRHADGSYRWFEAASSHYFEGGERKGLVCSFRHLNDRREGEQVLRASERKYRFLFERNVAGVYLCRMDGRILDCNEAAAKIFGFASREDMLHRSANDFYFSPQDRRRFLTLIEHFGSVTDLETECKRVDGSPVWILENAVLYEAEAGGERLLQGTVLDITERKRSEELQSALYRTASLTNSSSPTSEYFNSLQRILADLMYAENMYVAILDLSHKRLVFRYFADEQDPSPGERALGRGLTEYVLRTGAPLLADEQHTRELEDAGEVELIGEPCIDWMGAPLRSNGEVIGVIALQTYDPRHRYSKRDLEVLTFVAQHISAAIERERNQQAVRDSEESHRSLVQSAVYGIYRSSIDDRFLEVNPALVKMLGYASAEELLSISLSEKLYAEPNERSRMINQFRLSSKAEGIELRWRRKDGRIITVRVSGRVVTDSSGEPLSFEMIAEDVTERRTLEEQLRHSQKMEAVGRLAGGIAHDFNNLLTVIKGYSELMLDQVNGNDPLRDEIEEIKKAATRATGLTRQLLAFSRQQVLSPRVLDVNSVVANMEKLLRRLVGEEIRLNMALEPEPLHIQADQGQIEQVIMNLAVNARDAITGNGNITIESTRSFINDAFTREHADARPGHYVVLTVRDNGSGISEEVKNHIFEPFFTTKELGKGTGLGLSTVYGIVQQSKGFITFESSAAAGTAFHIYLPRVSEEAEQQEANLDCDPEQKGSGTVLLVEDEDGVRHLVRHVLHRRGYTVLDARHAGEALILCERHKGNIDLLVTDVVLEQISGPELAQRLKRLRPEMRVLYMSGYAPDLNQKFPEVNSNNFIAKPFNADALARKVHDALRETRALAARV